jgi:hypothetical protein
MNNRAERFTALDSFQSELIRGGRHSRQDQASDLDKGQRQRGRKNGLQLGAAFHQINIAYNFIFGGDNNTIITNQGNDIGSISFKAIMP